jgi:hypothetical protein
VKLGISIHSKVKIFLRHTAVTGQCPQEGPQCVAAQLPQPSPPAEVLPTFPVKADNSRSALFDPHCGQVTANFSARLRKRISKFPPHFLHLYSKIGIGSFPPSDPNIPCSIAQEKKIHLASQTAMRLKETHENVKADHRRLSSQFRNVLFLPK